MTARDDRRAHLRAAKIAIGHCIDCGMVCNDYTCVAFCFDHINPNNKLDSLSHMVQKSTCTIKDIDNEIAKCELVCATCHHIRTYYAGHHKRAKRHIEIYRDIHELTLF